MDIDVYVSNTLLGLPIEDEEIMVTVKVDSATTYVENDLQLQAPTDAKKFEDFL
jgi:hypothetical protein